MSWDNINGEAKILPTTGNSNEVIFETGKPRKFRLLLAEGEQPYSYLEHAIEVDVIEGGQTVHQFRTVRCPKTSKNPNAPCPLCDGQRYKRRARNAANVWDFDANCVRKLNQGDSVWKPIGTTKKMGVDVCGVDWVVLKTGEGRNDTEYSCTNLGSSAFVLPADAQLYNIEAEYAPATVEEMQAVVEGMGISWQTACTLPEMTFPSLADALAHVMPNGKYKGQTLQQLWDADKSPRGMINFLGIKSDRVSDEKAAAQIILVNLGGANIPGVPRGGNGGTVQGSAVAAPTVSAPMQMSPAISATPASPNTSAAPVTVVARQSKVNEINQLLSTKERFIKGSYPVIMEAMKKCGNGKMNIADFSDAELDALIVECNS